MSAPPPVHFESSYAFAVCNAGSESLLKADVVARHGKLLRPAFMRPQLITWKCDRVLDSRFALGSFFARVSGLSLGSAKTGAELVTLVSPLGGAPVHLHVFPRVVPEDGLPPDEWAQLDAVREHLASALRDAGVHVHDPSDPQAGDLVLDVIVEPVPDAPMFAGVHVHGSESHRCPGGISRVTLPQDAPSRAWLKLEQALAWARLDDGGKLARKVALELGSAPGGASYALLQRGVSVFGVDTAAMDPGVIEFAGLNGARFVHLAMPAGEVPVALLPDEVDLLLSDLSLAPPVMLRYVERCQRHVQAKLLVLTLKLNDQAMVARIPKFLDTIRSFAPAPVRATQLPANRSELCVVAGRL